MLVMVVAIRERRLRPLGQYERKAANQADEAIDDENDDVPDETSGSSQRIAPGQIIDAQRRYDCEGGKRGIPAQSAPPHDAPRIPEVFRCPRRAQVQQASVSSCSHALTF